MKYKIQSFVRSLAIDPCTADVFNQYGWNSNSYINLANRIRRENLTLYLNQMVEINPQVLLVGEAPGYRGCRRTGVPFTSEPILLKGVTWKINQDQNPPEIYTLFGLNSGYRSAGDFQNVAREASATVMWQSLANVWPPPLLWNTFPFHPHREGNPKSNRAPSINEMAFGREILQSLLEIFHIDKVVAVGKKAARSLEYSGTTGIVLRHPSHGGKVAFQEGLKKLIGPP